MSERRDGWGKFLAAAAVLSLALIGSAFPAMFSGVEELDDPGYMLVLIRAFNAHGGLYTHVFSQYGAFFSEWNAGLGLLLGTPTQDSIRWVVLTMWLGSALAGGALAFQLSGSIVFAVLAQGFCFLMLSTLTVSPGHPISLCVLCVAALALCAPIVRENGGVPWRAVFAGLALGALGMVKINLGVFALAAVSTAWAFSLPRDRAGLALRWAAGALLSAMPLLLVREAWPTTARLSLIALLVFSFLGILLVAERNRAALTWRGATRLGLGLVGGWGVVTAACLGGLLATGTRPADVLDGILLRPLRFANIFNQVPDTPVRWTLTAAVSLAGALAWRFVFADPHRSGRRIFELGARVFFLALAGFALVNGKGYSLLMPFVWVAVLPVEAPGREVIEPFTRRALTLLATTEFLSLYPVAGTQVIVPQAFGLLVVIVVAAQLRADLLAWETTGKTAIPSRWPGLRGWGTVVAGVIVVGVLALRTGQAWRMRGRMVPLDLPGSALVRCMEGQMARYTFLATNLRGQRSFLTLPGLNSLYGWTGLEALTGYNCTENFALLTPDEQRQLVAEARRCGPVTMVFNRTLFAWWVEHHGIPVGPLVEYQRRESRPLGDVQNFTLLGDAADSTGAASPVPAFTGDALLEQRGAGDARQPTGRILINAPAFQPAEALLVDIDGNPVSLRTKVSPGPSPVGGSTASGTLEITDPNVLRLHPPGELLLRLYDAQGRRLTTLPFFTPAEDGSQASR